MPVSFVFRRRFWSKTTTDVRSAFCRPLLVVAGLALLTMTGSALATDGRPGVAPRATIGDVRPGPDILYAAPPRAPQLENAPGSVWKQEPLLVSGGSAYRSGEFLYQGWLFDDHGAEGVQDPNDPFFLAFPSVATKAGTLTYPSDPRYASNAADLVELRVKALPDATAFRVTLNTMLAPERSAFTVAIGGGSEQRSWPAMAGVRSPADLFLTVHGTTADLTRADTGQRTAVQPRAHVDKTRSQVEVVVPHSAWDPGRSVVRLAAGTGIWDTSAGHYLVPGVSTSVTSPGGAAPAAVALFDVAFRSDAERKPDWTRMGAARTTAEAIALFAADQKCWWRECDQAAALRSGDVSGIHAQVDFSKLQRSTIDNRGVPATGSIDRIFASHVTSRQGIDYTAACGRFPVKCDGIFSGQLAPYNVYVPSRPRPTRGWGMTLMLHAGNGNYNEYMGSRHQRQLAERGAGSLTLTSSGRDPFGDFTDAGEADVFEAWADLARHYRLDAGATALSGYSMGGGGTFKLAQRWPDLFARGVGVAAVPKEGAEQQSLAALHNVPVMAWVGTADEGTPPTGQQESIDAMTTAGLRFVMDRFLVADHLTLATNDEYQKAADFLGTHRVVRNPSRVRFVVDPRNDHARSLTVADHAYWLSGLRARGAGADPRGSVDARTFALGTSEAQPLAAKTGAGVLTGGNHGAEAYVETIRDWASTVPEARKDLLTGSFRGLTTATLDAQRAGLDCRATLQVTTDIPMTLSVPACRRTWHLRVGATALSLSADNAKPTPEVPAEAARLPATGASSMIAMLGVIMLLAAGGLLRRRSPHAFGLPRGCRSSTSRLRNRS